MKKTTPKKAAPKANVVRAIEILVDGLKYHEHDGHNMPKRVARDALEALGIPPSKQP